MDGLLILITSILGPVLAATLIACAATALEILMLVVEFILELVMLRRRRTERRPLVSLRIVRRILLVLLALGALTLLALQTVLFDPMVRWSAARKPDTRVEFRTASGNIFTGNIVLEDVTIERDDPARGSLDLKIARLEVDIGVLSALSSPVPIERMVAQGVRGSYTRDLDLRKPKKHYLVEELEVRDVEIDIKLEFRDRAQAFPLTIDTWRCAPYRTNKAWFDVLLRSHGTGKFAGRPVTIESSEEARERETRWRIDALPLATFAKWIGGPLRLFTGGNVDIEIVDRWQRGAADRIHSSWSFSFREIEAAVPDQLNPTMHLLVAPIVQWISKRPREFDLEFDLNLDENDFSVSAGNRSESLRAAAAAALLHALAKKAGRGLFGRDK